MKTFKHNHSMSNFGLVFFFRPNELNFCHPASRALLLLLRGERETLRKSCHFFEVTAVQISGLVTPVFCRQTGFYSVRIIFWTEPLLKNARAGGTRVTLVVRVTFPKFVSFLQNLSLKVGRKTRQ